MERVLTDFVKTLRNVNIRVSPAETLDATEVIEKVGYDDRELLKNTLSLALSKTPSEKEKFDTCFDDFFREKLSSDETPVREVPDLPTDQTANSDLAQHLLSDSYSDIELSISKAGEEAEIREIKYFTQRAVFSRRILDIMGVGKLEEELSLLGQANKDGLPSDFEQKLRNELTHLRERVSDYVQQQFLMHGDVTGEQLREQVFKSMNMGQIDRSYLHEVHSLVRRMAKKLANMHSRRKKNFRRGKLDIRKTIQDNWINQGILFNLRWSYKKVDRPKILVICDVSGSVGIESALSKYGGGSTDYSHAFSDFVSLCIDEIDKKTTVVILGDARNNFGPEKAELLKSVYERSKQVYWLNPEGKYRWNTGDSVMNTYSAYCTKVFECGTLEQLERVISTLLKTAI